MCVRVHLWVCSSCTCMMAPFLTCLVWCAQCVIRAQCVTCLLCNMRRLKGATLRGAAGEWECFYLCVWETEKDLRASENNCESRPVCSTRFPTNGPVWSSHALDIWQQKSLKGAENKLYNLIILFYSIIHPLCITAVEIHCTNISISNTDRPE